MTYLLEVKGLQKDFGGLAAVRNVDLQVARGEIVGLIGPNGAGKTTLFNLIAGAIRPTAGEVRLDDEVITGLPPFEMARRGLARTFQIVKPFATLSVLQNVMVSTLQRHRQWKVAEQEALDVLRFLGLEEKQAVAARNLTLPERKRLEVARALATRPKLLLLDEVMAGLNPAEVDSVVKMVKQIRDSGVTIILVEHILQAVMALSDRVVVMTTGEKLCEGVPGEVARDPRVVEAYLGDGQTAAVLAARAH